MVGGNWWLDLSRRFWEWSLQTTASQARSFTQTKLSLKMAPMKFAWLSSRKGELERLSVVCRFCRSLTTDVKRKQSVAWQHSADAARQIHRGQKPLSALLSSIWQRLTEWKVVHLCLKRCLNVGWCIRQLISDIQS